MAAAIAALRSIDELNILDNNIKDGITRIQSVARFQEIKSGKLKKIVNKNKLFVDGAHNPLAAKVLNDYLDKINSQAQLNGLMDLKYLSKKKLNILEPALKCEMAILSPSSGIIDSHGFMECLL